MAAAVAPVPVEPGLIQDILDHRHESVEQRLMRSEDPNQMSLDGLPAIYIAIQQNDVRIVDLLLRYRAHYNYIDNNGNTILHFANESPVKNVEIMRAICRVANNVLFVQRRNNAGQTAYHFAAAFQTPDILDYLGTQGGDPTRLDIHNQSSLFFAASSGNLSNVQFLTQGWRMINVPDEFGRTPIFIAAQLGFLNVVDYLIRAGADVNIRDNVGILPREIAATNGHAAIATLLINAIHHRLGRNAWTRRRAAVSAWAAVQASLMDAEHLQRENAVHPNIPGRRNQRKTRRR